MAYFGIFGTTSTKSFSAPPLASIEAVSEGSRYMPAPLLTSSGNVLVVQTRDRFGLFSRRNAHGHNE